VGVFDPLSHKSFATYFGLGGDPFACVFDHDVDQVGTPVQAGDDPISDSHNYPQIVQSFDGYIHVFFGAHNESIRQATSATPNEITGFTTQVLDIFGTPYLGSGPREASFSYPMPFVTSDGTIYVFFRNTLDSYYRLMFGLSGSYPYRHEYFIRSTDNGRTWSQAVPAIVRLNDPDYTNEIYIGNIVKEPYREGIPERWHMAWTLAGGTMHDEFHKSGYHAIFQPSDEHFYSAAGVDLGTTIDDAAMDAHCLILETEPMGPNDISYINVVATDDRGYPILGDGDRFWDGTTWSQRTATGGYSTPVTTEWADGFFFLYDASGSVYQSSDGNGWTRLGGASIPSGTSGAAKQAVPFTLPHNYEARTWIKEQSSTSMTNHVGLIGHTTSQNPQKLLVTLGTQAGADREIIVRAFVMDEGNSRIRSSTAPVTFSLEAGAGSFIGATAVSANDGLAQTTFRTPAAPGLVRIRATAPSLADGVVQFYVK
jgi:hypothetical protein